MYEVLPLSTKNVLNGDIPDVQLISFIERKIITVSGYTPSIAGPGITAKQFEDSLRNTVPSGRYLLRPDSVANPIFDTTPTQFYDPTATTSTGSGTLANPFNTLAQVETYFNGTISGLAYGKVLGLKRGTVTRGKLELKVTGFGNGGRSSDNPFLIVPYGDSAAAPKIIGAIRVGGDEVPQWTFDGQFWWYDTGSNREVDVFQDDVRIYKKPNRAQALAAGPGFGYWIANKVFVIPYTNGTDFNSISTLVEVNSAFGGLSTNLGHTLLVKYKNQARSGNIVIAGVEVDKAINSCISIQSDTSYNIITFVDNLQVVGCTSRNSGVDQTALGAGSDAVVITGPSDTVRASNVYSGGNLSINCLNNSTELNGVSSGVVEWNTSYGCGGNNVVELFASCSNVKTRFNFGSGAGDYAARTVESFSGGGIWVPGYVWDQAGEITNNPDITKNSNNDFQFNASVNNRNPTLTMGTCSGSKVHNNTLYTLGVTNGSANGSYTVGLGLSNFASTVNTVDFSNNVVINGGQDNVTMQLGRFSGARNITMTGDNNIYWNLKSGYGQNATISTVNNNGATVAASNYNYTNIESWTAGVAAGGTAVDTNGRMWEPKVNLNNARPQFGTPIASKSVTLPAGFITDLGGKLISTSFVGPYQI